MILRRALILSARRDYVHAMREILHGLGDETTRIDVEMDALRALQLTPGHYDLIVLDAVMETMDGLQLLLLLKLQAPTVPIVIVSDGPGEEVAAHAYQNGADLHLMRPATLPAYDEAEGQISRLLIERGELRSPMTVEEPAQRLAEVVRAHGLAGDSVILLVQGHFQSGDVFMHGGEVHHAQYPGKSGVDAFHDMMRWDGGLVRIKALPLTNIPPRTIEISLPALLAEADRPFVTDLSATPSLTGAYGPSSGPVDAYLEAPPRTDSAAPAAPFLPDRARPGGIERPKLESYWKVNLMGELVEGTSVADPERSAFITTLFYRKMAEAAVALEVDYFDTLVLLGPDKQQVLVADNLGIRHAVFDAAETVEPVREQFVQWCREQSL
jgi:CheY-like chemotaxis protein